VNQLRRWSNRCDYGGYGMWVEGCFIIIDLASSLRGGVCGGISIWFSTFLGEVNGILIVINIVFEVNTTETAGIFILHGFGNVGIFHIIISVTIVWFIKIVLLVLVVLASRGCAT
jgi:hypothetical protein